MTRRKIDGMRELRLWIGQIVIPGIMAVVTLCQIPGVRDALQKTYQNVKEKLTKIFKKDKSLN